jgi:hypothetical protein
MLTEIAKNRLRPPKDVNAFTINSLTADNGRYLGGNLAAALAVNLTAQNGVDEWIVRHPVLKKIDEEFVWFRPLVACAGKRLLANVSWGSKARLYTTSFVSLLDLFFDVYMVLVSAPYYCASVKGGARSASTNAILKGGGGISAAIRRSKPATLPGGRLASRAGAFCCRERGR